MLDCTDGARDTSEAQGHRFKEVSGQQTAGRLTLMLSLPGCSMQGPRPALLGLCHCCCTETVQGLHGVMPSCLKPSHRPNRGNTKRPGDSSAPEDPFSKALAGSRCCWQPAWCRRTVPCTANAAHHVSSRSACPHQPDCCHAWVPTPPSCPRLSRSLHRLVRVPHRPRHHPPCALKKSRLLSSTAAPSSALHSWHSRSSMRDLFRLLLLPSPATEASGLVATASTALRTRLPTAGSL